MNKKHLSALLGGLLATSIAMATVPAPDYTLLTSDNLVSSSYDSGYYTSNWSSWLGQTSEVSSTTANVLGTYKDSLSGQWFQTTQFTTVVSFDRTLQDVSSQNRNLTFIFASKASGDQWVDLSLTSNGANSFSISAYGTPGSKTSPHSGFQQLVSPVLGQVADTTEGVAGSNYLYTNSWQAYSNGSVNNNLRIFADATDGGSISDLYVTLSGVQVLGAIRTEHVSYTQNQWTQNVAISAPVPEPEGWAMMMAGLGLVGFVARRRQRAGS